MRTFPKLDLKSKVHVGVSLAMVTFSLTAWAIKTIVQEKVNQIKNKG